MRLSYLAQGRFDIADTVKHLAQRLSESREFDFVPLKRAARYLVEEPTGALRFRRQKHVDEVIVFVDSDFADDPVSRKSTTGLVAQIGNQTVTVARGASGATVTIYTIYTQNTIYTIHNTQHTTPSTHNTQHTTHNQQQHTTHNTQHVDRTTIRTTHLCTYRSCAHCPHRCLTHAPREHAWLKRTAQSCMHWCLKK